MAKKSGTSDKKWYDGLSDHDLLLLVAGLDPESQPSTEPSSATESAPSE